MDHINNQLLQTFAMTKTIGLVSFLALFDCHFGIFTKYLGKQYSLEARCLTSPGFPLVFSYLIKSFPGMPLYGTQYLMNYGFASATIWGCLPGALQEPGIDNQR